MPVAQWIEQRIPDPKIEGSSPFGHAKSMSTKKCYLRIDGDTYWGISTGIPRLLELLSDLKVSASFFLTTGGDDRWASLPRIVKENGFGKRILKLRSSYFKLPAKIKTPPFRKIAQNIISCGHEIGVHGYNHFHWIRDFKHLTPLRAINIIRQSKFAFKQRYGFTPPYTGAPGWRMSYTVLELQDELNFKFASDVRGDYPFLPKSSKGKILSTVQIPVNLPTLDEILMMEKSFPFTLSNHDIYCAHAEMEGADYISEFKQFIQLNLNQGCSFHLLGDYPISPPLAQCQLAFDKIPGRTGEVLIAQK